MPKKVRIIKKLPLIDLIEVGEIGTFGKDGDYNIFDFKKCQISDDSVSIWVILGYAEEICEKCGK